MTLEEIFEKSKSDNNDLEDKEIDLGIKDFSFVCNKCGKDAKLRCIVGWQLDIFLNCEDCNREENIVYLSDEDLGLD